MAEKLSQKPKVTSLQDNDIFPITRDNGDSTYSSYGIEASDMQDYFGSGGGGSTTPVELENNEYVFDGTENSITIDISNFDGTDLRILTLLKSEYTGGNEADGVLVRFNNDAGTNYGFVEHFAYQGGDGIGTAGLSRDNLKIVASTDDTDAGNFAQNIIDIVSFKSNNRYKVAHIKQSFRTPTGGSNRLYVRHGTGIWYNTNPITSITFSTVSGQNFKAGSRIKIYTEKIKGQAIEDSGETFTTWVLKERKEITADTDTVEFAGLDGDSDEVYKLVSKIISGNTGSSTNNPIEMFINEDTNTANYDNQRILGRGTTSVADEPTTGHLIGNTSNSSELTIAETIISAKSGSYRALLSHYFMNQGQAIYEDVNISTLWKNSVDNITSLTIKGVSNGIGAGSVIELWAQKEVTMPTAADTPVELENGEYVCDGTEDSITIDVSEFEGEDLKFLTTLKTDRSGYAWDRVKIQFNNDTGNNYDCVWNESRANQTEINDIDEDGSDKDGIIITVSTTDVDSEIFGNSTIFINKFSNSNFYKNLQGISFNSTTYTYCAFFGGIWKNTAPITTITFKPYYGSKFIAGSRIKVYSEKIKGQTAGGSGETFTTWVLKERKEITSDTDTVEFTGLDGDSYNNIKILGKVKVVKDNTELYIQINDDTTATNYRRRLTANGGNITDQGYPGIELGTTSSDELAQFLVDLQSKSGKYRTALVHSSTHITASGISENLTSAHVWYNENDNITKLALKGSESTAIGAGSVIELWVQKEVTMPTTADTPVELENGEYVCDGTESSITIDVSEFEGEDLIITALLHTDNPSGDGEPLGLRFNNDTGSNYSYIIHWAHTSNQGTDGSINADHIEFRAVTDSVSQQHQGACIIKIPFHKKTDIYKNVLIEQTWQSSDNYYRSDYGGCWKSTNAIQSITLYSINGYKFISGSKVKVYSEKIKGQVAGGSGETFTTWVLKERKEIASDTDTVEFTGLDGDNDKIYQLIVKIKEGNTGETAFHGVNILFNDDSNTSNYNNQQLIGDGTSADAQEGTIPTISVTQDEGDVAVGKSIIYTQSGSYRIIQSEYTREVDGDMRWVAVESAFWKNISDNITKITIKGAISNAIGVGSTIELWVQKEVTMPTAANTPIELENGEAVLSSDQSSITVDVSQFEGENLIIYALLQTDDTSGEASKIGMRFNNDSGNNYACVRQWAHENDEGVSSGSTSQDNITLQGQTSNLSSEQDTLMLIKIPLFKDANFYKKTLIEQVFQTGINDHIYRYNTGGVWRSTDAITSITFYPIDGSVIKAGSKIKIYTEKIKGQAVEGAADTPVELENGEAVLSSDQSSITIDISQFDGDNLKVLLEARTDNNNHWDVCKLRLNSDSGSNYSAALMQYESSHVFDDSSYDGDNLDGIPLSVSGDTAPANMYSHAILTIVNFKNTSRFKAITGTLSIGQSHQDTGLLSGFWKSTAAITSITLAPVNGSNFKAGTSIKVYTEKIKGQAVGGAGSSSTTENIGFTEIKTDRDFEVSAGQWKPIYIKKIDIGPMPDAGVTYIAHNISDLEYVISIKGHTLRSSDGLRSPLPYAPTDITYAARIDVTNTDIRIGLNTDWSAHDNAWVILEYTKTSDTATSQPRNT